MRAMKALALASILLGALSGCASDPKNDNITVEVMGGPSLNPTEDGTPMRLQTTVLCLKNKSEWSSYGIDALVAAKPSALSGYFSTTSISLIKGDVSPGDKTPVEFLGENLKGAQTVFVAVIGRFIQPAQGEDRRAIIFPAKPGGKYVVEANGRGLKLREEE